MIRILIAGVIAALLAMTLMEKQQTKTADIKNLPAETQEQLNAIMQKNEEQKEKALKELGL